MSGPPPHNAGPPHDSDMNVDAISSYLNSNQDHLEPTLRDQQLPELFAERQAIGLFHQRQYHQLLQQQQQQLQQQQILPLQYHQVLQSDFLHDQVLLPARRHGNDPRYSPAHSSVHSPVHSPIHSPIHSPVHSHSSGRSPDLRSIQFGDQSNGPIAPGFALYRGQSQSPQHLTQQATRYLSQSPQQSISRLSSRSPQLLNQQHLIQLPQPFLPQAQVVQERQSFSEPQEVQELAQSALPNHEPSSAASQSQQAPEPQVSDSESVPLASESQRPNKKRKASPEPPAPPEVYQPASRGHWPGTDRSLNKSFVAAVAAFNDAHEIPFRKTDLYSYFQVPRRTGSRTLKNARSESDRVETRGRKPKITVDQIRSMDTFIAQELWENRAVSWSRVGAACGVITSDRTIQRHMGSLDYSKCINCRVGYVNRVTAAARVRYAERMLERFPTKEDWRRVRFSDDVHFGFGPGGRAHIIRKHGQRYCPDCIGEEVTVHYKDERRASAWGAFGYNFKSNLVFFENKAHKDGKLTPEMYRDVILETEVKSWIQKGDNFILQEESQPALGLNANNVARDWKNLWKVDYQFNIEWSPDFSPITMAWHLPKDQKVTGTAWNDSTTTEIAMGCWEKITQEQINEWCDSMPDIMREVIACEGRMTPH